MSDPAQVANLLADAYMRTCAVDAVVLAGSRGRGRDDAYSDLELDVYWTREPSDALRREVPTTVGGTVRRLWPYDPTDAEWSDDLRLGGVEVTVSGFAHDQVDRWIAEIGRDASAVVQMRMSALHEGEVLAGEGVVEDWRERARYPRALAVLVASTYLRDERLVRWRRWRALRDRNDLVILQQACADVTPAILGPLAAINRVWLEHPSFKWVSHLVERLDTAPPRFGERFAAAVAAGPSASCEQLAGLLTETLDLLDHELPEVDTAAARSVLRPAALGT